MVYHVNNVDVHGKVGNTFHRYISPCQDLCSACQCFKTSNILKPFGTLLLGNKRRFFSTLGSKDIRAHITNIKMMIYFSMKSELRNRFSSPLSSLFWIIVSTLYGTHPHLKKDSLHVDVMKPQKAFSHSECPLTVCKNIYDSTVFLNASIFWTKKVYHFS